MVFYHYLLLLKLLNIDDCNKETLSNIKVSTDYLMSVESRLNQGLKSTSDAEGQFDFKGLNKESQTLLFDITYLLKEKLSDEESKENYYAILYLYHLLQSLDNVPEIKYIFGYMSKTTGFTNPEEYKFQEDKQFIFEGILYSALTPPKTPATQSLFL